MRIRGALTQASRITSIARGPHLGPRRRAAAACALVLVVPASAHTTGVVPDRLPALGGSTFPPVSNLPSGARTGSDASASPAAAAGSSTPPLHVAIGSWSLYEGCDIEGRVAAPAGVKMKDIFSQLDIRDEIIAAGGGAWFRGALSLIVSVDPGRTATITGVSLERKTVAPPAWAYEEVREFGPLICGGGGEVIDPKATRPPTLDHAGLEVSLDRGRVRPSTGTDGGVALSRGAWRLSPTLPFVTLRTDYISACLDNYAFSVVISYRLPGEANDREVRSKPVTIYGKADDTRFFGGYQDNQGEIHGTRVVRTGSDRACAGVPGARLMAPIDWGAPPSPEPWMPEDPTWSEPTATTSAAPSESSTPTPAASPAPEPSESSEPTPNSSLTPTPTDAPTP